MFHPTPITASNVGIVYSLGKKIVYGHHYVEDDSVWGWFEPILLSHHPGKLGIVYIPMEFHLGGHSTFYPAIARALGHPDVNTQFTNGRCAIIDTSTNLVEHICLADDTIDTIEGKILINHSLAEVGHSYDPETKLFTRPAYILPAKSGGRNMDVIVPATVYR